MVESSLPPFNITVVEDKKAVRLAGVVYQNTTGRTLFVNAHLRDTAAVSRVVMAVIGQTAVPDIYMCRGLSSTSTGYTAVFTVPPQWYYTVTITTAQFVSDLWTESY